MFKVIAKRDIRVVCMDGTIFLLYANQEHPLPNEKMYRAALAAGAYDAGSPNLSHEEVASQLLDIDAVRESSSALGLQAKVTEATKSLLDQADPSILTDTGAPRMSALRVVVPEATPDMRNKALDQLSGLES